MLGHQANACMYRYLSKRLLSTARNHLHAHGGIKPQWRSAETVVTSRCKWNVTCIRHESTAAAQAKRPSGYRYPEWLNVYRIGSARTLSVGFSRVLTVAVFVIGSTLYSTAFFFSPEHSNLWLPAIVVGCAVPMVVMVMATGPFIHSIKVQLPGHARKTRDGLMRFANNVPSETRLSIASMKLLPWPTKQEIVFADLSKHRPSWSSFSNLEWSPLANQGKGLEGTVWHGIVTRFFGRFYVARDQRVDRSAAPGVWDAMWDQIPQSGGKVAKRGRVPAAMRGRSGRTEQKPLKPSTPAGHRPRTNTKAKS